MAFIDYYEILGIPKTANADDIKSAYRKQARKLHPDLNPNDKDAHKKFQQVNEANEVLSDPEKRKKYDTYGKDWEHGEAYEKARRSQPKYADPEGQWSGGYGDDSFSDFFTSMFGGSSGKSNQQRFRGQDYRAELRLSLTDAYSTKQQTLTVNGKNLRITIPAGIANGQIIKLKGHGSAGVNGGPAGDLFITFIISNNTAFKRDGDDLHFTVDLDLYIAVLGGEITIDTLAGKIKLKIKPGTQNGSKTRLKGKGFPVYKKDGHFGDLYLVYSIKLPTDLSEKEKELFTELSNLSQLK